MSASNIERENICLCNQQTELNKSFGIRYICSIQQMSFIQIHKAVLLPFFQIYMLCCFICMVYPSHVKYINPVLIPLTIITKEHVNC